MTNEIERRVPAHDDNTADHAAHLRYFRSMDRLTRAIQGEPHFLAKLRNGVAILLDVFGADRAWLLHPCDADAPTFRVPVEATRPEFPGAGVLDRDVPMAGVDTMVRAALAAGSRAVCSGPPPCLPVPEALAPFRIASQIFMVLRPRVGRPWLVGLHQCSHVRHWSPADVTLFEGLGARFEDILSSLLLEENLREAMKMEAFGQFAGGIAHDFNNALMTIQGNADLLLLDSLSTEQADTVEEIRSAAQRAARLTRQLLMFSRRQAPAMADVNINDAIGNLTKLLRRVTGRDIELTTSLTPDGAWVTADPCMIEQVLVNLAVNAREAMPTGGTIEVSTALVTLDASDAAAMRGARAGAFLRLRVSDTGCGIADDVLPRIFEPFFTTKDAGQGPGIGLATVYSIAEQHHGWVHVETAVDRGTTFDVYLPRPAATLSLAV